MISESDVIRNAVSILGSPTLENPRVEEKTTIHAVPSDSAPHNLPVLSAVKERRSGEREGVSVGEKNGILGILLEVIEGGGWKGDSAQLEDVLSKLEEE